MKITNLKKNGNQFSWTIIDNFAEVENDYETDEDGHGIWVYGGEWKGWKQIRGTGDFTLHGYSLSGARNKIKKELDY